MMVCVGLDLIRKVSVPWFLGQDACALLVLSATSYLLSGRGGEVE